MAKKTTIEESILAEGNEIEETTVVEAPVSAPAPKVTPEVVSSRKQRVLEEKRMSLVTTYREEDKVPVTISPLYAPYLGKVVRQSVNGIMVEVPADGNTYQINKTHANHILAKIRRIDDQLARQKRLSDVQGNQEHMPGELHL